MFREEKSIDKVAELRDLKRGTICSHLAKAVEAGMLEIDPRDFYSEEEEKRIAGVVETVGLDALGPVHEALSGEITYEKLHFFRAMARRNLRA